jgi:SpoVK/Ycf46/Vps4 family AAA+-type ATPase
LSKNKTPNKATLTKEYYDLLIEISNHIYNITEKLKKDETFTDTFKNKLTDSTPETFIPYCVLYDTAQILKILTSGEIKRDSIEMTGLVLLSMKIIEMQSNSFSYDYKTITESHLSGRYKKLADSVLEIANKNNPLQINITETNDEDFVSKTEVQSSLSLPATLKLLNHPLFDDYVNNLYRFATIIAKADNIITKNEEDALKEIYQITHNPILENENKTINITDSEESENLDQVLAELENLIGLEDVKREVKSLINFIQIQKEREKQGLKNSQISYHCVFTGSPGTGKTTIARIVAKIYKHLGILEKGHLVETDRSGLVAEYTGQTAIKVNRTVDSAMEGILFIDEAYSLVGENKDDFGKEAVATLIKRMEDNRDKLVLIVAGYSEEMETFIETNPGFKSRFNRYINFPDFTPDEMIKIYELLCSNSEYFVSKNAKNCLTEVFKDLYKNKTKDFGNGRLVRNIFEKSIENQSNRIALTKEILTKEILTTIEEDDIPKITNYSN